MREVDDFNETCIIDWYPATLSLAIKQQCWPINHKPMTQTHDSTNTDLALMQCWYTCCNTISSPLTSTPKLCPWHHWPKHWNTADSYHPTSPLAPISIADETPHTYNSNIMTTITSLNIAICNPTNMAISTNPCHHWHHQYINAITIYNRLWLGDDTTLWASKCFTVRAFFINTFIIWVSAKFSYKWDLSPWFWPCRASCTCVPV